MPRKERICCANRDKSVFVYASVNCLNHVQTSEGIKTNLEKMKAIVDMRDLITVTKL